MTIKPDLTIVLPAYCEQRRIGKTLETLASFLQNDLYFRDKAVEVLVITANSLDRTKEIVEEKARLFKNLRLLEPGPHVGKGRDVQYGMLRSCGLVVMYMDADLATPLPHLKQFYTLCKQGYDVVIGTRNLATYRGSRFRNMFARLGNVLYRAAGGMPVEDTQCGFKMFSQRASRICFNRLTIFGWGFDQEVLAIASANKLNVQALRINDWVDKPSSTYTEGPLKIMSRSLRDFVRIRLNTLRGRYIE